MESEHDGKHRIFIDKIGDRPSEVLRSGLEFIGWDNLISKSSRVFIKPNFTFPQYRQGVTTNPQLLRPLLLLLRQKAGKVMVGESDGGNRSFRAEDGFKGHGMYEICREAGAELVNLSDLPSEIVEGEICGKKVSVTLPRLLLEEIDCFISVPVLKVHAMTKVTLSLKNSWGCVPDTMRGMHHQNLSLKLALIAQKLKPKIIVIDGTYALNKHGPMFGEAVQTDLVIIADNTVTADAFGARVMGFSPEKIPHIVVAERAGLGSLRLSDSVVNQDWRRFQQHFTLERTLIDFISVLPFNNDKLAKLIFQSSLTSLIYRIVPLLRNQKEKEVASRLGRQKRAEPY